MNLFSQNSDIVRKAKELFKELDSMDIITKVELINQIKIELHNVSPLKGEPVDCVLWIHGDGIHANDYNPNSVAPPEMKLLEHSIMEDGFTQPIVTFYREEQHDREVIDGFHRNRVGKESKKISKRIHGFLPVVTINQDRTKKGDRIASTIRHNRARGKHKISAMSDIILDLKKRNWSDKRIAKELGMDQDEVLRLAQITGLAELFTDKEFSEAWEAEILPEREEE